MENLRWVLLGIGALLIIGIYLWDYFNKKNIPKRRSEVIFNGDNDSDLPMTPYDDEPRDYLDAISGLNKVLDHDEPESNSVPTQMVIDDLEPDIVDENFSNTEAQKKEPKIRTVIPRSKPEKPYDLDKEFFGDPIVDDVESISTGEVVEDENVEQSIETEEPEHSEENIPEDELIIMRITSKEDDEFKGLKLLTATKNVEMKFGNMNIFHHYGVGDMKTEKPLFSLANMYEPGEFNLQEMDSFTTKGIVLYMSLPTPIDAMSSFELMLNTCQRIADDLDGELKGERGELVDDAVIDSLREKVRRFS